MDQDKDDFGIENALPLPITILDENSIEFVDSPRENEAEGHESPMKHILHTSLKFNLVQIEDEIENKNQAIGHFELAFDKQKEIEMQNWDEESTMEYNMENNMETDKDLRTADSLASKKELDPNKIHNSRILKREKLKSERQAKLDSMMSTSNGSAMTMTKFVCGFLIVALIAILVYVFIQSIEKIWQD